MFIDDVHRLAARDVETVRAWTKRVGLSSSGPGVKLVLVGRDSRACLHPSAEISGAVGRIGLTDLAMTQDETRMALGCTKAQAREVHRRYRGWPVAVAMLGQQGGVDAWTDTVGSPLPSRVTALLQDLVEAEILSGLDRTHLDPLCGLAILSPVDLQAACDVLSMPPDEVAVHVRSLEPLIVRESAQTTILPYVAEALQRVGWASFPSAMKRYHSRASDHFQMKGETVTALTHTMKSGNPDQVANIIENAGGVFLWLAEGMEEIQEVMGFVDAKSMPDHPRLLLIQSLLHTKSGELAEARRFWNLARAASRNFLADRPGGDDEALRDESRIIGAMMAAYGCHSLEDQINAGLTYLDERDATGRSDFLQGYIHTLLCVHALQNGIFEDVMHHARRSEAAFERAGSQYGIVFLNIHRSGAAYGEGRLKAARALLGRTKQKRARLFPRDDGLKAICNTMMAELDLEAGSFLSARRGLSGTQKNLVAGEAWFDVHAAAYRTRAYLDRITRGPEQARDNLADAAASTRKRGLERVGRYIDCLRLELACRADDAEEAERLGDTLKLGEMLADDECLGYLMWREYLTSNVAQVLASRLAGDLQQAESLASRLHAYGERQGNAICRAYGLGLLVPSRPDLAADLVDVLQESGLVLPLILDPTLWPVLSKVRSGRVLVRSAEDVLRSLEPAKKTGFTKRERSILTHLQDGTPDKVIAQALGVSVHTVRFHLKNIFAKTGLQSRHDVARIAPSLLSANR
ncbi:MAG: LuxR C-terminal-related transcriptional regulator [Pseudomonadota bacterium]